MVMTRSIAGPVENNISKCLCSIMPGALAPYGNWLLIWIPGGGGTPTVTAVTGPGTRTASGPRDGPLPDSPGTPPRTAPNAGLGQKQPDTPYSFDRLAAHFSRRFRPPPKRHRRRTKQRGKRMRRTDAAHSASASANGRSDLVFVLG